MYTFMYKSCKSTWDFVTDAHEPRLMKALSLQWWLTVSISCCIKFNHSCLLRHCSIFHWPWSSMSSSTGGNLLVLLCISLGHHRGGLMYMYVEKTSFSLHLAFKLVNDSAKHLQWQCGSISFVSKCLTATFCPGHASLLWCCILTVSSVTTY